MKVRRFRRLAGLESLEARTLLTGFTAYNSFYAGLSADPSTTSYADAPGKDSAGPLIDIATGQATDVLVTAAGTGAVIGGNGTAPAQGTDAHDIFADFVDFASSDRRTIELFPGAAYQYLFENLDVGAKYSFTGTAIRGNPSYSNRWTLVELIGAESFKIGHSENVGIYRLGLDENQVAIWTGDNAQSAQGQVVSWQDIDPGPDGIFHIVSSHYTGSVPAGIASSGRADGAKGYGLSAFQLIEQTPEGPPSLVNSTASNVMATSAILGGRVIETGGQLPAITMYYGTTDGGTDPAAWTNSVDVASAIDFAETVDGLEENTAYYFRGYVEHPSGSAWAPESASFTTLLAGPPAISNLSPSRIGALTASLVGQVDDTCNDSPLVTLYYGENDGGTNPAAWDNAIDLGVQSGTFSVNIGDLRQNTDYVFTTRAQNGQGTVWGAPTISFRTLNSPRLRINEFMADNASRLQTRVRASSEVSFVGDRLTPDWIEVRTSDATAFDIGGYFLTDDLGSPAKWQFPAGTKIPADGFLVVFASGINILDPDLDEHGILHTSFQLDTLAGSDLAIADRGARILVSLENIPTQVENISYGIGAQGEERYFSRATPGADNAVELPQAPTISLPSQTFTNSITVELTAAAESHSIHYTTNETKPTASSPVYTGPIELSTTTMLRAISVGPNGDQSIIVSESYIELPGSMQNAESHLPLLVVNTFGDGIPSGSTFGDSFVAIIEPGEDGKSTLADEFTVATRAGIHVRGSSSAGFSKKQFRVEFRDQQDEDSKLEVLGMPKEADWIFYGPSQYDRVLISNPLMFDLSNQIGRYAARTRWVEAYFDGRYAGVYAIMEVIERGNDRVDVEQLSTGVGGVPVEGGFIWKNDRGSAYVDPERLTTTQRRYINGEINQLRRAAASQSFKDPLLGYEGFADVDSFIDHNMLNLLAMNVDALRLSSFYYKTADGKLEAGPIWDFDRSLDSTDGRDNNPRTWFGTGDSTRYFNGSDRVMSWWSDMFQDPDFVQRYIDRWTELRRNEFSLENLFATIDKHAAVLGDAADRDYARWGRSRYRDFAGEIQHLRAWLKARVEWIDSRWLPVPTANVQGSRVPAGTQVTLSSHGGNIYYMLDGTDPRGDDGVIRSGARLANQPIAIQESTHLVARIYDPFFGGSNGYIRSGDDWSGPLEITAVRIPASAANLAITEIHYNPARANVLAGEVNEDNDEFEFVEVTNVGSVPIELEGVRLVEVEVDGDLRGVRFEFDQQILQPRESLVVVENEDAFRSRYDDLVPIAMGRDEAGGANGQYGGRLSNGGERVTLLARNGDTIRKVDYADDWHKSTDGEGFSLVNQTPATFEPTQLNQRSAWASSSEVGGTPGIHFSKQGDFDGNGMVNIGDLDLVYAALGTGGPQRFDLTHDGLIDGEDVSFFVLEIMKTREGDANLDGRVSFVDFLIVSSQFGMAALSWATGDFNADGTVDFGDFLGVSANFGFDTTEVPDANGPLALALLANDEGTVKKVPTK